MTDNSHNGVTLWLKNSYQQHSRWQTLNVDVEEFRSKKSVATVAEQRIRGTAENENQWKTFDLHHQMARE